LAKAKSFQDGRTEFRTKAILSKKNDSFQPIPTLMCVCVTAVNKLCFRKPYKLPIIIVPKFCIHGNTASSKVKYYFCIRQVNKPVANVYIYILFSESLPRGT
jgi:hypothetical protein